MSTAGQREIPGAAALCVLPLRWRHTLVHDNGSLYYGAMSRVCERRAVP